MQGWPDSEAYIQECYFGFPEGVDASIEHSFGIVDCDSIIIANAASNHGDSLP